MQRKASLRRRESLIVFSTHVIGRKEKERKGLGDAPAVGSVLSLALRLRKKKSGVSQTQIPKKVAMSPKVGVFTTGPPRYALRAI